MLLAILIPNLLIPRHDNRLMVTFLDVGQGDAIVIRTSTGAAMLVDCGPAWDGDDAGRRTILPYLRSQSIQKLDALFLTHPDMDHIGGAPSILRRVTVKRVFAGGDDWNEKTHPLLYRILRERRLKLTPLDRGKSIEMGEGVKLRVLNPGNDKRTTDNEDSLVIRLEYGNSCLLLTGDAGAEAEANMLHGGEDLRAQLIKIAHHGSRFGSMERFLKAVHPQAAIILVGKRNRFGHPAPAVMERLEGMHVRVYRTDRDGAITAETDGNVWRIRTVGAER